jgi:hypothetical protein
LKEKKNINNEEDEMENKKKLVLDMRVSHRGRKMSGK